MLALGLSQEASGGKIKGNALLALILFQKAIACYDKAYELDPDDLFALSSKGAVLEALGGLEEAFACYERVLEIDPLYARGWIDKGDALRSRGRADEALACYDKALAINPRDAQAWRSKGMALLDLRRWVQLHRPHYLTQRETTPLIKSSNSKLASIEEWLSSNVSTMSRVLPRQGDAEGRDRHLYGADVFPGSIRSLVKSSTCWRSKCFLSLACLAVLGAKTAIRRLILYVAL